MTHFKRGSVLSGFLFGIFLLSNAGTVGAASSSLQVSIDGATPATGQVTMGSTGIEIGRFRFTETSNSEDVRIVGLNVYQTVSSATLPTLPKSAFGTLVLYKSTDLAVPLATASGPYVSVVSSSLGYGSSAYYYKFNFATPLIVPRASAVTLVLKGDVAAYSSGGVTDNTLHTFQITPSADSDNNTLAKTVVAFGNATNNPTSISLAAGASWPRANTIQVLRTKLTASGSPLGATSGRLVFDGDLGNITFTADAAGSAALNKFTVTFSGSGPATPTFLDGVSLFDSSYGADVVSLFGATVSTSTPCVNGGSCRKTWSFGSGNGGFAMSAGSSHTFRLGVAGYRLAGAIPGVAHTLTASVNFSNDILFTDALDNAAITGIPLSPTAVPVSINSVTYATGTGGGGGGSSLPDLSIAYIYASPVPVNGSSTTFYVGVQNTSLVAVTTSTKLTFYLNGFSPVTMVVPPLGASSTYGVAISRGQLFTGSYTASAEADSDHLISESNELNNSKSYSFTVSPTLGGLSDLATKQVGFSLPTGTKAYAGAPIDFYAWVWNAGTNMSPQSNVRFSAGTSVSSSSVQTVSPIATSAPGSTLNAFTQIQFPAAGTYTVTATVDPYNLITESNEGNNIATTSITVLNPPYSDLVLKSITTTPNKLQVTLCNYGLQPSRNPQVNVTVNSSTNPLSFSRINLRSGGCETQERFFASWRLVSGQTYLVSAVADPKNELDELNEANNTLQATIVAYVASAVGQAMPTGSSQASTVTMSSAEMASVLDSARVVLEGLLRLFVH